MSQNLEIRPAAAYSLQRLAALFTACYEGYKYPVNTDSAQLATRIREEGIDLASSFVLVDDRTEAGLVLLGRRGHDAWCGGFGVIRPHRGRGLGRRLAAEMVARARASGASRLLLEVLCSNDPARRLYEGAGLRTVRELLVLSWAAPAVRAPSLAAMPAPPCDPAWLASFAGEPGLRSSCWQRSPASLLCRTGLVHLASGPADQPGAHLVLAGLSQTTARIVAINGASPGTVSTALRLAQAQFDRLGLVNEPADSPWLPVLQVAGFAETDRQFEMAVDLTA